MESGDSASVHSSSSSTSEHNISIWQDEKTIQHENREILNSAIEKISDGNCSPVRSTLNTDWNDISDRHQNYMVKKTRDIISNVLKTIAPGQENELWKAVKRSSDKLDESSEQSQKRKKWDEETVKSLVAAYDNAESSQTRTQILSIFVYDFSKSELQQLIPGLSKFKIDTARKHAVEIGAGKPLPEQEIKRHRLDPVKVDHFLDFISTPTYLQDTAYGTRELKLDDGTKITIPNAIRTVIPGRIIRQYQSFCKSIDFEPASETTLYRILRVCSASQQKSLQGLDYVSTEGAQAFDTLNDLAGNLYSAGMGKRKYDQMRHGLKEGKFYLKTDYKMHLKEEDSCPDHCCKHALSDPQNDCFSTECNHEHNVQCNRCYKLDQVMDAIKDAISSANVSADELQRLQYEFDIARSDVEAWKAHILRTYNQESAKHDILDSMNGSSIMLIMDWAMKFLPTRFREQMTDFYGKRGRSWHVSAVIVKTEEGFEVECYVHLFNSCTQNWFSIASIIEHVLSMIKNQNPNITDAYLKSDNAGCYHNSQLLLALPGISRRTGISIQRYDFSDPQSGKDICDRKISPMKGHIRRFVNEKNDVVSAEDMKRALESHGGVKGCNFIVAEVDMPSKATEATAAKSIEGISLLNNFTYEESGIRCWKAYKTGKGKLINADLEQQRPASLKIIEAHDPNRSTTGTMMTAKSSSDKCSSLFYCEEQGCVLAFRTYQEVQLHMDTGIHSTEQEKESSFDVIRKKWAVKVGDLQTIQETHASTSASEDLPTASDDLHIRQQGWALKATKKSTRFQGKVKDFLTDKINEGVETGRKADPMQVSTEMRHLTDETGNLVFSSQEWKTTRQITSFFARLSARQRQRQLGTSAAIGEEIEQTDIDMWDNETGRLEIRDLVFGQLDISHPIRYRQYDLCGIAKQRGKLKSQFKIKDLIEICDEHDIEPLGTKSRKDSFVKPLQSFIEQCVCFKQTDSTA